MNNKSMISWKNPKKKQLLRFLAFRKFSRFHHPIRDIRTHQNLAKNRSKHKGKQQVLNLKSPIDLLDFLRFIGIFLNCFGFSRFFTDNLTYITRVKTPAGYEKFIFQSHTVFTTNELFRSVETSTRTRQSLDNNLIEVNSHL
jgi:hypothetical protein